MVFSDLFFLFVFIPAFVVCYLIAGAIDRSIVRRSGGTEGLMEGAAEAQALASKHTVKNFVLIIFSLIFYAWGEPVYIFLMIISVIINYWVGRGIGDTDHGWRKFWLVVGVGVNLAVLGSFKYLNFVAEILRDCGLDVPDPKVALPIGISFYIFQSISYLVDVYRRESPVQKSFWGLLLYISMFPQLIAGPIVRYSTVAHEIHNRHVTSEDIADGIFRFLIGLGKKVIIANQMGELCTSLIGGDLSECTVGGAWIGIACFSLQIYFDFSGYSDMAIGIGRCLGFHFNENFDHPYTSKTITEFWRRWHMSLGTFFRDYVYIPLGGNRRHQLLNIMVVWALTGLWHGAAWNFILWGLYFGIILLVEKHTILKIKDKIPSPLLYLYALAIVLVGWGVFYFDNMENMGAYFRIAFGMTDAEAFSYTDRSLVFEKLWLLVAAVIFCMPVRKHVARLTERMTGSGTAVHHTLTTGSRILICCGILIISIILLIGATNNAFLYTRF